MTYPKIDKPTVPGWYWAKLGDCDFQIVRVWADLKWASMAGIPDDDDLNDVAHFTDWHGPIPLPEPTP